MASPSPSPSPSPSSSTSSSSAVPNCCSGWPSPAPPSSAEQWGMEVGMAAMELDAARALADLAGVVAMQEEEDSEPESSASTRSRKRSKSESTARVQERSFKDPETPKLEGAILDHRGDFVAREIRMEETEHIQESSEVLNLSISCGRRHDKVFSGRGKQKLTEVEKDEKRLRRILANRESARQSIRRRQALREELTRRVADLSLENENMKMEKEFRTREYISLKDKNDQLKEQIAKMVERTINGASTEIELSISSSTTPSLFLYKRSPFLPHVSSSWLSTPSDASNAYKYDHPSNACGSVHHLYFPLCACHYPFFLSGSIARDPHAIEGTDAKDLGRTQEMAHSYMRVDNRENFNFSKDDAKCHTLAAIGTRKENGNTASTAVSEKTLEDAQVVRPSSERIVRKFMDLGSSAADNRGETHHAKTLPEDLQSSCALRAKKSVSAAAAAAEARKRRKELTKLKHFPGT